MDWLVFWDVQRYSVHSVFNFTQSTVVNKTQIWLRSWLLCWRRQSDVGSDASSTCLAVLLFCCSAVWLFCCFADVMNRTELCSYTFDICEGVKLVRRPRVCRPTRLIYLYFFFSFRFPIFCVCPFLFVCLFVGWLVVCFVCLQIACRLNPFRWLFRLCVPSFSFFFFTSFSMGVCDCIASGSRRRRGRAPSRLPPDSATFVVASAASSLIESGNGGGREVLLQGCYCQMGNTL